MMDERIVIGETLSYGCLLDVGYMLKYLHGIATIHESVNDIWPDERSLDRSRLNWYRPIGVKKIRVDTN